MPGIGISPCPPFNNMPGVPGILYDGNTAAWFDYNDSRTVGKDGANRVGAWMNKINFSIGPEIIDQGAWYTTPYWNIVCDVNWSQVGTTFVSNGNSGNAFRAATVTIGKPHRLRITINRIGGTFQFNAGTTFFTTTASGTFDIYFVPTIVDVRFISTLFNGSVTSFSIVRIPDVSLIQFTGASQPLWSASGILFDGSNDHLLTESFAYVQPETIYIVLKFITWTNTDVIFDGLGGNVGKLDQSTVSPNVRIYVGTAYSAEATFNIGNYGIITTCFNGANSTLQVNRDAVITGNYGAANMTNFQLARHGGAAIFSNIEVKEIVLRKVVDSSANQNIIYNFLKRKNSL